MREPFQGVRVILLKRVNEPINKAAFVFFCMSKKYDWLELKNSGMDVTFEIGPIPVRFFADFPNSRPNR